MANLPETSPPKRTKILDNNDHTLHSFRAPDYTIKTPHDIFNEDNYTEEDSTNCIICSDPWDMATEHKPVSLKCGHIFGRSCILRWLTTSKPAKGCPFCNKKFKESDLILLYSSPSTSSTKRIAFLNNKVKLLQTKLSLLESQMSPSNPRHQTRSVQFIDSIQEIIPHHLALSSRPSTSSHSDNLQLPMHYQLSSSTTQHPSYVYYKTFDIIAGFCCSFVLSSNLLLLSSAIPQQSTNNSPNSLHGILKITSWESPKPILDWIPLHTKPIRSLQVCPSNNDLVLSSSLDGSVKITNIINNKIIVSFGGYSRDIPIWSTCWDHSDPKIVYLSTRFNQIFVYDIDSPDTPLSIWNLPHSSQSKPTYIHSLFSIQTTQNSRGHTVPGGLMAACSNGIYFFTFEGKMKRHSLGDSILQFKSLNMSASNSFSSISAISNQINSCHFEPKSRKFIISVLGSEPNKGPKLSDVIFELDYSHQTEDISPIICDICEPSLEATLMLSKNPAGTGRVFMFEQCGDLLIPTPSTKSIELYSTKNMEVYNIAYGDGNSVHAAKTDWCKFEVGDASYLMTVGPSACHLYRTKMSM